VALAVDTNAEQRSVSSSVPGSSYQYTGQTDDIDARDENDPLAVTSYVQDMYDYFRTKEVLTAANPGYMDNQSEVNSRMRGILVDWLLDVHLKFRLVPETLYLTVNIIDRFLETSDVPRQKLQLIGVTALLIGSKYEEIYPPQLEDLVSICDGAFTENEIVKTETVILKALEYKITIPSAHVFLVRYLKAAHADRKIVQLSCYILDGTLQNYDLLQYLPSQLAAAAVLIARNSTGRNAWSPTLLKYTAYTEEDVMPVAKALVKTLKSKTQGLDAVERKYAKAKFGAVAGTRFHV